LGQHPSCVFFIGQQLVECLPVPFVFFSWGGDDLPFQTIGNLSQTVTAEVTVEDPTDNGGLIGVVK